MEDNGYAAYNDANQWNVNNNYYGDSCNTYNGAPPPPHRQAGGGGEVEGNIYHPHYGGYEGNEYNPPQEGGYAHDQGGANIYQPHYGGGEGGGQENAYTSPSPPPIQEDVRPHSPQENAYTSPSPPPIQEDVRPHSPQENAYTSPSPPPQCASGENGYGKGTGCVRVRDEYDHPNGGQYTSGGHYERMIPLEVGSNRMLLSVLRTRFPDAEGLCYGQDKQPVPKEYVIEDGQELVYLNIPNTDDCYCVDYRLGEEPLIGIALSGGGTRAAMTAVGALRRLWELGILQRATTISSVSGGGLVNAMLALNWVSLMNCQSGSTDAWENLIAEPVRLLCSSNIALKVLAYNTNPLTLAKVLTRQLTDYEAERGPLTNANILSEQLCRLIPVLNTPLADLPKGPGIPNFVFCCCDMKTGGAFYYTQDFVGPNLELLWRNKANASSGNNSNSGQQGHHNNNGGGGAYSEYSYFDDCGHPHLQAEYFGKDFVSGIATDFLEEMQREDDKKYHRAHCTLTEDMSRELSKKLKLSDAIASSATYPLIFDPFEIDICYLMHGQSSNDSLIRLTDGGVYDNLGLDPLLMSARVAKKKAVIFLNDAQATSPDYKPRSNWVDRNVRALNIISSQLTSDKLQTLKEKYLNHELYGAYWSLKQLGPKIFGNMDTRVLKMGLNFPGPEIFDNNDIINIIKGFRTDLNRLNEEESNILENTGYLLAAYRFQKLCAGVLSRLEGKRCDSYFVNFMWPHPCGLSNLGPKESFKHSDTVVGSILHGNKKKIFDPRFYTHGVWRSVQEMGKSIGDIF